MININLLPILHRFLDIAVDRSEIRNTWLPLLCLTPPTKEFSWDDLREIFSGCQWTVKVANAVEILPKIWTAWVGCTSVTDDRETTDGRATANSEREREFQWVHVRYKWLRTKLPYSKVRNWLTTVAHDERNSHRRRTAVTAVVSADPAWTPAGNQEPEWMSLNWQHFAVERPPSLISRDQLQMWHRRSSMHRIFMVALCNRADHYIFIQFLSSFFFLFSSPNLSGRIGCLPHGVALVRI